MRRWVLPDARALHHAVAMSAELLIQLGVPELGSVAAAAAHIRDVLAAERDDRFAFAITVDGHAVGSVMASAVEHTHDTAWMSYWLAASHRGLGLATRGLATVSAWAFAELGLFRLELGHRVNNPPSCRVAARAGFAAEGIERARLRYGTMRYDVETHARLRTDPSPDCELLTLRP